MMFVEYILMEMVLIKRIACHHSQCDCNNEVYYNLKKEDIRMQTIGPHNFWWIEFENLTLNE